MRPACPLALLWIVPGLAVADSSLQIRYDMLAPLSTYFRSQIVDLSVTEDAWSMFVSPEWIDRHYGPDELVFHHVSEEGAGLWFGFGYRPWRKDFARAFRVGLHGRAREVVVRTSNWRGFTSNNPLEGTREEIRAYGFGFEAAWTLEHRWSSQAFESLILEPYVRVGLDRETDHISRDGSALVLPETSHEQFWILDLRWGFFGGWSF